MPVVLNFKWEHKFLYISIITKISALKRHTAVMQPSLERWVYAWNLINMHVCLPRATPWRFIKYLTCRDKCAASALNVVLELKKWVMKARELGEIFMFMLAINYACIMLVRWHSLTLTCLVAVMEEVCACSQSDWLNVCIFELAKLLSGKFSPESTTLRKNEQHLKRSRRRQRRRKIVKWRLKFVVCKIVCFLAPFTVKV